MNAVTKEEKKGLNSSVVRVLMNQGKVEGDLLRNKIRGMFENHSRSLEWNENSYSSTLH